ncbi:MAG TPA: rhodanese-like domain-containing protein [Pyrinomonadaceae bacterium]
MRYFVSGATALLVALTLLAGGAAAQSKKKKRTKTDKAVAAKTTKAKSPEQPYTGDPVPPPQKPEQGDGVRRITPAEAREALDKGAAIIIDVRNEEVYHTGHVKGAILITVNDFVARIKDLPRDKMIITYCS